jgi:hypothetical protein
MQWGSAPVHDRSRGGGGGYSLMCTHANTRILTVLLVPSGCPLTFDALSELVS